MSKLAKRQRIPMAFALGGLGGNNFFGLGFLAAAVEKELFPRMISATSGQIHLIWLFQKARDNRLHRDYGVNNLKELAAVYSDKAEIKPVNRMDPFISVEVGRGMYQHALDMKTLLESGPLPYSANLMLNFWPARMLNMETKDDVLRTMAKDFNADEQMGIVFNSYDPTTGTESVYLNPTAAALLGKDLSGDPESTFRHSKFHSTVYRPITQEAIRSALWLYEYGFDGHTVVDGCYFRQIMLHELTRADLIVCVRPLRSRWTAELPAYWLDKEDLKTKVFFNAAYAGERFRVELMNRLIAKHDLSQEVIDERGYHEVRFLEIEPSHDWPASSLFAEEMPMFDDGFHAGMEILQSVPAIAATSPAPEPQLSTV